MKKVIQRVRDFKLGTTLMLVLLVGIWSIPTIGLLVTAFRTKDSAASSGWWEAIFAPLEQEWSLAAFETVLTRDDMFGSFVNTLVVAVPATVLPIMIAAFAAYAFTFIEFRGREIYFAVVVALMVVPLQAALVPVVRGLRAIKEATGISLIGSFPGAWLMHAAFALPLAIYILRNYMMTLPMALIEAARIDGASWYQIFWKLVMPMSVPALASFAIFQFLWVWNDYLIAFIFVDSKPVMTYRLLRLLGQYGDGWQDVAAGSFISLIVPLVVFFALQRFFVRGLTAGSVK
ncbi:alpha-glucoside transport system permease protein [Microbacteriaceae bacterium MWH-Ta3]|nr:alpha-glucoside transport system permease protein [Microbacteriaceae bacterium MWH-Ta3]